MILPKELLVRGVGSELTRLRKYANRSAGIYLLGEAVGLVITPSLTLLSIVNGLFTPEKVTGIVPTDTENTGLAINGFLSLLSLEILPIFGDFASMNLFIFAESS